MENTRTSSFSVLRQRIEHNGNKLAGSGGNSFTNDRDRYKRPISGKIIADKQLVGIYERLFRAGKFSQIYDPMFSFHFFN